MYHIVAGLIGREMHAMYEDILPEVQGQGSSTLITYIVNSIKNKKGKPCKKDLPLLKNDITGF